MIGRQTILAAALSVALVATWAPIEAQAQEQNTEAAEEEGWITVRPGDTLFSIARRHEVSVDELRDWNDLPDAGIRAGMRLRIAPPSGIQEEAVSPADTQEPETDLPRDDPASDASLENSSEPGTVSSLGGGLVSISLGPGETLFSLASQFGMSPDSLASLNPDLATALEAGMLVVLPEDRVTRQRTVKPGDTLFSIAREEGVSVEQLRAINSLSGSSIRVGQQLQIPASEVPDNDGLRLPAVGEFSIQPYPGALSGRTLADGRVFRSDGYLIGHPTLPAGSIVLVVSDAGDHVFAEVVETAPARRPVFIEGSGPIFEALALRPGDPVSLYRVN